MLKETYDNNYNSTIISYNKDKNISFNWELFLKFLKVLQKKNISLKINLIRNHKTYDGIYNYLNKLNISYDEFINDYIPNFLSYQGYIKSSDSIEEDKKYYWDIYFYDKLGVTENPFKNLIDDVKLEKFNKILRNWLNNYRDDDNMNYLPEYNRTYEMEDNEYQNLYQHISNLANSIGQKKYEIYFKNNIPTPNEVSDETIYNYLKMFYYMIKSFFIDMSNYNSINLINYNMNYSPILNDIIDFLNKQDFTTFISKLEKDISDSFIDEKMYFNKLSHHLFITPYLYKSSYLEKIDNIVNINEILEKINEIDNFCIDKDNFDYNFKEINPLVYLKKWKEINSQ